MKFNIQTSATERHAYDVTMATLFAAKDAGAKHILAHVDSEVQVAAGLPSARQQIYAQLGFGDKGMSLANALNPEAQLRAISAGPVVADEITVTGRLAVQAFLYDTIEKTLRENDYGLGGIFTKKAALVDSIAAEKFDRPILDYTPINGQRSRAIAQLSEPASLLTIKVSQNSYAIPGTAIGVEYSDQAARATTLRLVALAIQRQAEEEASARIEDFMRGFVNGDADFGMPSLATVADSTVKANALDPSITTAGTLSQTAWVSFLFRKSRSVRIDTVITDLKGALAIENRKGRPTVQGDNANSKRIDAIENVLNPTWADKIDVIITQDPQWPAGTIVGFDSRYAYHLVNSTVMSYQATEEYAIRRSSRMRLDSGSIAYRLYDQAWQVLDLSL